jgi:DNA-directed RNA polymerase subunit alpha
MEKFTKYKIEVEKEIKSENFARFAISPLERGFGITLGNALRRVLLGFVPSGAVFAVRINGVTHEYQALNGVMEDMVQIILNLKSLAIKIDDAIITDDELEVLTLEK